MTTQRPGRKPLDESGTTSATAIWLSPRHKAKLEALAKDQDRTMSAVVRRLLDRTPDPGAPK